MNREFKILNNTIGWEDVDAVLIKIQMSFNVKFDGEALKEVSTFGGLCDLIATQINRNHGDTCTTQHAFYKLRCVIANVTAIEKYDITPQSRLSKLFAREDRLRMIAEIDHELGFETSMLQPKQWVISAFSLILLASSIAFFYNWPIAAAGCLASVLGLKLAGKFGKEIHLKTVGDLANKISRESYLKARRNPTVNKNDIEQKVRELFASELHLEPVLLTRRSQF
jgi:hypothetical protein